MKKLLRACKFCKLLLAFLVGLAAVGSAAQAYAQKTSVEVYATGLFNPKGMVFAADGSLYVAESGKAGAVSVPAPDFLGGKVLVGNDSKISRITPDRKRQDYAVGLPNAAIYGGAEVFGLSGIAIRDGRVYAVSGESFPASPALSQVSKDGSADVILDVGKFNDENPPFPNNGDAINGNPYDLVEYKGDFYITDGNFNRVLKVTADGHPSVFAKWDLQPVTTGATLGPDTNLYVAQFGPMPFRPGTGRIDRIDMEGRITQGYVANLQTPIDVAFGHDGTMYILQYATHFSATKMRYVPYGGQLLRVNKNRSTTPIVTNLIFPTMMITGKDGALYVTNFGNESVEGQGQVLRIVPGDDVVKAPNVKAPAGSPTAAEVEREEREENTPVRSTENFTQVVRIVERGDDMRNWGYEPSSITIRAGESVLFVNKGRSLHTATDSGGSFDTGLLRFNGSMVVRFGTPGTFNYFCVPHPMMKGRVTVTGDAPISKNKNVPPAIKRAAPEKVNILSAVALLLGSIAVLLLIAYTFRRR